MKDYKKLDRLTESHETMMPEQFLGMTIGQVLDGLEGSDTDHSSTYEMVEGIFMALKDQILSDGYEGERDMSGEEGQEGRNPDDEVLFDEEEDENEFPSFDQVGPESDGGGEGGSGGMDNFNF